MKVQVQNYTFNAAAKTVTFTNYSSIELERVLVISNVTDGIIIFNFAVASQTGTVSTNVLTLTYDTTSMSNTDDLAIFYDDPALEPDFDTGGGVKPVGLQGLALPGSGGPVIGGTSSNPIRIDPTGTTTQPVSVASIAAGTNNIGDVDIASIAAGDNTVGRVKITDGTLVASVRDTGSSDSLNVAIVDGSGNQVTSFGGGTQYTEGDTDASITGTAVLWEDASDTLVAVSAAKPLPIGDAGGSLTVDGTVTANAGTNLNTSALALEGGGNLAAAATSLGAIDDWDESDRAKVNPIVGQAGVQGGAGASTALTQRVAIATDANAISDGGGSLTVDGTVTAAVGVGATDLGKAEDAVHASGDVGVMAIAVRRDTDISGVVDTDGDYSPLLVTSTGRLKVADITSQNSLGVIDDWDESDRAKVNPIVGQAGVQGGSGTVSATTQRVVLATDVALPAGTNGIGKLTANSGVDIGDVDVTSVTPGTGATNLGKAEDAAHTSGDVGVMSLGVANEGNTARAADNDYVPLATDTEGNIRIVGNRDHDAVDAGEPVKVGMKAVDFGADPTEVAALDRVDALATRHGILWTLGGMPNIQRATATINTATTTDLITNTSGERIVVTAISAFLSDDATGNQACEFKFESSGRLSFQVIPVGSGFVEGNGGGVLMVGPVNTKLQVVTDAAQVLYVQCTYFKIPSA